MIKVYLFILLIGFSINNVFASTQKILKRIESCQILTEESAVFAGSKFSIYLEAITKTGEFIYSNTGKKIGFNDFIISVDGGRIINKEEKYSKAGVRVKVQDDFVSVERAEKRLLYEDNELELRSNHDLLKDPFVRIKVQMIKFPEIQCSVAIPVHFKGNYWLGFSGEPGVSGKNGNDGISPNGAHTSDRPGEPRYILRHGTDGEHGVHGTNGKNAESIEVYVSLVKNTGKNSELVRIETREDGEKTVIRYLEKTGHISINARGGYGGNGGNGGNGGGGLHGATGEFVYHMVTKHLLTDRGTKGGTGGNGGTGGDGGNAGHGGNGGDVNLYFTADALFFKDRITINNYGGLAGKPGFKGIGGQGGEPGNGGKGYGEQGENGREGLGGYFGLDGERGQINYYQWRRP